MSFSIIIPARYASTRLPGKPLLDIAGKPMIQHVYERAEQSQAQRVIIATDDQRIADAAKGFGAEVAMTKASHESGTDRLQEVAAQLQLPDEHILVNVQGDEPLIPAAVINQVANNLSDNSFASMATLIERIADAETVFNPNAVKVVINKQGQVLYFSRAPMPWCRDLWAQFNDNNKPALPEGSSYYRHIGIYAYRVNFLHDFVQWPMSMLEQTEKLEQLRAMENGVAIHAQEAVQAIPTGIDTAADLAKVRAIFAGAEHD
ncbi:3-deoxy-manno-octulosonate cytidylyltransferase [Dasania sp. GY-MA-18]|uniref:3-deoxy-manno-octulosonate cytidylyltransferase n=1 Tax=Dasania phycosphaerae TaxID=2950436 RepID=A0A9J6RJ95_9GAMM|nr:MULTISPECIES: 3-deoxy-manno-octulosonate cytidylyltransferase [Dasania]MCR8921892.1 3-deoxy-manno-octulosonate cytidylyltransferase [Dasania sp. GY-MA-18]MCZ0864320.1 3-deoxy-manno-octulosonate cytidylyltransferase [Dasania phycosphaerae]MCZ0868048.1 3-deoxy-manno-octulosonate cytidylyltransferase [Dasania phycosphaerae]